MITFLDFSLQSQLATAILALHAQTTTPYFLALIVYLFYKYKVKCNNTVKKIY